MSKSMEEDAVFVDSINRGDKTVYKEIVDKYHDKIYYMLLKKIGSEEDARDLTQEAFIKAFKGLDKFDCKYAFSTWLFRIAHNNFIDFVRKKRVLTISMDNYIVNDDGDTTIFELDGYVDTPNDLLVKQERARLVVEHVKGLSKRYRTLLELRYMKEFSYQEIANEIGIPLGTVKAQLFKAKKMLKESMAGINI